MNFETFLQIVKSDIKRYDQSPVFLWLFNISFEIIFNYRLCQYLKGKRIVWPLYSLQRYIYRNKCIKYGCDIPSSAKIGKAFRIDHPCGIVINSKAIIGDNCTIKSGVVIGKKDESGVAIIGNNVMLGVHAIILGNITIGDNVDIGAGTIVTHSVPDNTVVHSKVSIILRNK